MAINLSRILHLPKKWDDLLSVIWNITFPIFMMIASFLIVFLPIRGFVPSLSTPDIPLMILFCIFFHKFSVYLVPLFFLCTAYFENIYFIPHGFIFSFYFIFAVLAYIAWGYNPTTEVSFRLIFFYYGVVSIISLIMHLCASIILFKTQPSFVDLFYFWLSGLVLFPLIFHFFYYACMNPKKSVEQEDV